MEVIIILLRFILLYASVIGGSMFIAYKANKKIENCIVMNFGLIIVALYIFGLFEGLKYGVWVVAILNIILGIYTIIKNWKNKENFKEIILTPGFMFFSIVFFILMIVSYNKNLVDYDHFFYRSFNTKVLYTTDCMSKGYGSLYTPATNLIEYFFMKVIGIYLQGIEAFAVQILGFSLLIPLFDKNKKSKFIDMIISILIICIPAIFKNLVFYESAYPDALLGLIIGYCMYMLVFEKNNKFKLISTAVLLSVCTITKPIGFFISGIIIAMYLIIELLNNKENIKKFAKSKELKNIIILIFVVVLMFSSWEIFKKINNKYNEGVRTQNASRVEGNPILYALKSIATTTFGYYEENHDAADSNNDLIPKLYSIEAVRTPIRITLYGIIVIIVVSSLVIYKNVIEEKNKKEFAHIVTSLIIGLILYILLLQLSYIIKFSTSEMLGHNGLDRYLPTFLLAMLYVIIAITIKNMQQREFRKINYIILVAIILAFTPLQSIANVSITSGISNIDSIEYCNNGRIPAKEINEKIEKDARVISLSGDNKTDIFNWMIKYYLYPDHNVDVYNNVTEKTIENIEKKILNNDEIYYICLISTSDELNELINNKFNIDLELEEETLLKVQKEENKLELTKIPLD